MPSDLEGGGLPRGAGVREWVLGVAFTAGSTSRRPAPTASCVGRGACQRPRVGRTHGASGCSPPGVLAAARPPRGRQNSLPGAGSRDSTVPHFKRREQGRRVPGTDSLQPGHPVLASATPSVGTHRELLRIFPKWKGRGVGTLPATAPAPSSHGGGRTDQRPLLPHLPGARTRTRKATEALFEKRSAWSMPGNAGRTCSRSRSWISPALKPTALHLPHPDLFRQTPWAPVGRAGISAQGRSRGSDRCPRPPWGVGQGSEVWPCSKQVRGCHRSSGRTAYLKAAACPVTTRSDGGHWTARRSRGRLQRYGTIACGHLTLASRHMPITALTLWEKKRKKRRKKEAPGAKGPRNARRGLGREGQQGTCLEHRISENTKKLTNRNFVNIFNVILESKSMQKDHSGQNTKR